MATAVSAHGQHAEEQAFNDRKLRFGMIFYIVTDVAFSIFLTSAYPFLRQLNTDSGWFPYNFHLDFTSGNQLTIALVISALLIFVGMRALQANNQELFKLLVVLASLIMIGCTIAQTFILRTFPFAPTDGSFASTYVTLSFYHLYHLLIGSILAVGITMRALHDRYTPDGATGLRLISYYWYWVALYSVILTLLPIVLPPKI